MGFRIQSLRGGWCRPEDCKQMPHRQSRAPEVGSLRLRFWVEGLEFGVFGLGGQGFGFRVWGVGFGVYGSGKCVLFCLLCCGALACQHRCCEPCALYSAVSSRATPWGASVGTVQGRKDWFRV